MQRLALAGIGLGFAAVLGGWATAGGGPGCGPKPRDPDFRRLVFHAVLEGCYADGVTTAEAKAVLRADPATGQPMHFVDGCPLCMPALDAFALYAGRPPLRSRSKGSPGDTFGPGLDETVRERLGSDVLKERLDAVNTLVDRWIRARIETMRPTADERDRWTSRLKDMMEKGTAILRSRAEDGTAGAYGAMKGCAVCQACCSGAVSAR